MSKSVIRVDEAMLAKFLLVMPDGVSVTSAKEDRDFPYLLLSIEGDAVPAADQVKAFVTEQTEDDGRRVHWMTFEPA